MIENCTRLLSWNYNRVLIIRVIEREKTHEMSANADNPKCGLCAAFTKHKKLPCTATPFHTPTDVYFDKYFVMIFILCTAGDTS